jgi:tRNA(adenine34) deaminase
VAGSEGHHRGVERLDAIADHRPMVGELRQRLLAVAPSTDVDGFVWQSCVLALEAMASGNYGVGAVIVQSGTVVAEGRNRLIEPYIRTGHHAEMEAVDTFEDRFRALPDATGFTLYSSLECCPMCTVRLINTGIREIYYAAPDPEGGMLERWQGLPPFWQQLAARRRPPQMFARAACTPQLSELASDIFHASDAALDVKMASR